MHWFGGARYLDTQTTVRMPVPKSKKPSPTIILLLAEDDVLVRFALAEHLRSCGLGVIEAASAQEAKTVLLAGAKVDIVLADAQLAGPVSGFALAQWVRRNRPGLAVVLSAGLSNKAQAAHDMCTRAAKRHGRGDPAGLYDRIAAMIAERDRRARKSSSASATVRRLHSAKRSSN